MNVGVTTDSNDYAVRGPVLFRLAPWDSGDIPAAPDAEPGDEPDAVAGFVQACAGDTLFMEALALASPPTARAAELFVHDGASAQDALRLAMTLSRYAVRMSSRATPFGLFAGVALARTGPRLELTLGSGHRKAVRPDGGRLTVLARSLETAPDALPRLRIGVNPHCRVRGSRLVLPTPTSGDLGQSGGLRPASVRRNQAVDEILRLCRTPLPVTEIVASLLAAFPQLTDETAGRLLGSLVARGFLVTDLRPPLHVAAPSAWLREHAPATDFDPLDTALVAYRDLPVGEGSPALQGIRTAMRALGGDHTVAPQVDMTVDAEATIPPAVLAEIERAAAVMWRVSPGRPLFTELRRFHTAFVERYGMGRAVPVGEVLDPRTGLDAPPGYRHPRTTRRVGSAPASPAFVATVGAAVQQAMLRGEQEIDLTPELVDALDEDPDSPLWSSFDVTVQVLGEASGEDFTLVCSPTGLTRRAGQVLGRFARLLGITGELRDLFAAESPPGPRAVQLEYRPREDRMVNVAQVPRLLPAVSVDHDETGALGLHEIGVCADADGLYAVSLRDGGEIEPAALHMANPARYAPNAARLLTELELSSARSASPWQWRELEELPWLPRIRTGRTILHAARWKADELVPAVESDVDWSTAVKEWRARWRVPERVVLSSQTQQLPLRLDRAWDLRLFRHELQRRPDTVVLEDLTPPESRGWAGGRACEITAMVFGDPRRRRKAREPVAVSPEPVETHGFGGEWLYLKLFCDPQSWDTTIAEALGDLIARLPAGVDRQHWLRYPEPSAHVRLRLHAEPEVLYGQVIPLVREWSERARAAGLLGAIETAEYEPETRRYGSGSTLTAAEEVFEADGAVVLAQLRTQTAAALKAAPEVLAALNFLRVLHDCGDSGRDWLLTHVTAEGRHGLDRAARKRAAELVDFSGDCPLPRADALPADVAAAWEARTVALRRYIAALDGDPDAPDRDGVIASLLHMHFNRHAGPDRAAEHRALSLAREIVHAHDARRRHR